MDEEEQKQSDSKISVSSFFERVDSADKVANSALSKANANLSVINTHKSLINSINVSIEALQTKVRDIANYIIIQQKAEKDAEEDRLFEQQDESQKGSMLERLAGLKSNNESEQTQAAGEEPKKGGGGILGTLLSLGIGAFALKFLWPVVLPLAGKLITGALAKFATFSIGGLGSLLKGVIVGTLGGLGIFGLGKMFTNLGNSIKDRADKVAESAKNAINNFRFGKEGKVDGPDSIEVDSDESGGEGEEKEMSNLGPDYKQQEEDAFKAAEEYKAEKSNLNLEDNSAVNDMDETLEKKDLKKKIYIVRGTNLKFDTRDEAVRWILNYIETKKKPKYEESVQSEKGVDIDTQNDYEKWLKIFGQYVKSVEKDRQSITNDEIKRINDLYVDFKDISPYASNNEQSDKIETSQSKELEEAITPNVENKDLDLSLSDSFSDKLEPLNNQIDTLSEDFTGSINAESGQMFSRPANSPNTTVTVFKQTSSNSPFTSLMSNKYLSLNKTLPPEVYRAIK